MTVNLHAKLNLTLTYDIRHFILYESLTLHDETALFGLTENINYI